MTRLVIPELSLVVLVGCSGAGKSTFARSHFKPTEILSSDFFRGLVSDDENEQSATADAFEALHFVAGKRLAAARLTVIDATNVQPESRKPLVALARKYHALPVAVVLDVPEKVCRERNRARPDRDFGGHVVRQQASILHRSMRRLKDEGFRHVYVLSSPEEIAGCTMVRQPLWNNRKNDYGPFDIVGDVHGCYDELVELLAKLGYAVGGTPEEPFVTPPAGRKAVFLGDLVDRGPGVVPVLRLVIAMAKSGAALMVPGNHEMKLLRKLRGKDVRLTHGLEQTMQQLGQTDDAFKAELAEFIDGLVSHYVLDGGKLVVAHAGLKEAFQGRASGAVREFCLYGESTGETDEYGLPIRYDWATDYRGSAAVVYGHTPVPSPEWHNRTLCIDTGCVFGGALTALRWPERELVSVEAKRVHYEPARPLVPSIDSKIAPRPLDYTDVAGKRIVHTRYAHTVTIRETHAAPALEVMSRFAVDPRWLVYLPPTMSPPETAAPGQPWLERPEEAFAYFAAQGVRHVVCEEKHMGSRAVIVACRDESAAAARFDVDDGRAGVVYTRTGRPFFGDASLERAIIDRVRAAMASLWDELETDWLVLDAEILPWSAKAIELLRTQYAAVASAGLASLDTAAGLLAARGDVPGMADLAAKYRTRHDALGAFRDAYRRYCWDVRALDDYRIAPFHVLAAEGRTFVDRSHVWHMETLARLAKVDPALLMATRYRDVDLEQPEDVAAAIAWWEALTDGGGEGMVVKPREWIHRGPKGLVQPALKCRGREYLRIIYGPEYAMPEHLERLRGRQVRLKRTLAMKEFSLGMEALHRFVAREPLFRVHECVFAVLALESEPVDPRL
ncbi:polynucleotide kinase-phosphatase [Pendulispora brunnea]|uniref:Polynucleotide kinase-phosphatase n=1 Tax=Pendulispora brunnea TaxID=2905690 RepID=A0ABZ2JXU4_9BACT